MLSNLTNLLYFIASMVMIVSCQTRGGSQNADLSTEFKEYWYKGKAEITSYDLKQARYGELHSGDAVLIFVTEDISRSKHVKLDDPSSAEYDRINVLKLNYTRKFNTGIYPYSMMMSVFSPVHIEQNPRPLKITMSVQEWCGHVFTQSNLKGDEYDVKQYSYFESEGDKQYNIDAEVFTEDELWNRIRIDYRTLPVGKIEIIPALFTSRLLHFKLHVTKAEAILREEGDDLTYSISYSNGNSLKINFKKQFPHVITGWEETAKGLSGKFLTSTAVIKDSLITDYWRKNKNENLILRDSLGLK